MLAGGDKMHERISKIRKESGLTQEKFAQQIGISKNYVNLIENNKKKPGDRLIADICRAFNINEHWLRTGKGEPHVLLTRSQIIADFSADLLKEEEESFRRRFVEALATLDVDEWKVLEKIIKSLQKKS